MSQRFEQADADHEKARAAERRARAALQAAERQLDVIDTQKQQTQAALDQALAERDLALLNLAYTEIRSPIDGVVGNRSARAGAYATVGAQLLAIVPARGLWVDANFKESQLARIREGQSAEIIADVLPGVSFRGRVASLAPATGAQFSVIPPQNATGNFTKIIQRVPVRIELEDDDAELGKLRPGLSVAVYVDRGTALPSAQLKNEFTVPIHRRSMHHAQVFAAPPASPFDAPQSACVRNHVPRLFHRLSDIQIVSASVQEIGGGLSASQDELSWIQSSYLIAEIIVIPLSAWLSRVMSTRWLIAASSAGFTLASVLCSTAWDMRSMIVFRALQGFFGGAMIRRLSRPPSSCFKVGKGRRRVLCQRRRRSCATLGPVVGGWLTDGWSWHWLFYVNIVPGTLVMCWFPSWSESTSLT